MAGEPVAGNARGGAPGNMPAPPLRRRVCAVIVTHNGRAYIEACLRSLLESAQAPIDVIVVDNASTDGTPDLVRNRFPGVHVLAGGANLGYGGAINEAARHTAAEYLAILNQDTISNPGWIDRLVAVLERDRGAALATPMILLRHDPSRLNTFGIAPHITGITTCRGYNQPTSAFRSVEEVLAVSGAAFVIRRSVFDALGGFDASFFLYFEDTDLSLRAVLAGHRCLSVPEASVLHEFEARFSPQKLFYLERNRHAALLKLYRPRTLIVLGPALLLTELAVLGYSLLRGPACLATKVRAYGSLLGQAAAIRRARARAQARRRVPDRELLARATAQLDLEELGHPVARWALALINPFFRLWNRVALGVVGW